MKILFLQNMNWFSGSELLLAQMLPALKNKGFEVEMLVIHKTTAARNTNERFTGILRKHNIRVIELYGHHPLSPVLQWKIHKILQRGKYDIAHCNLPHADFWMAVQKCFFFHRLKLVSVKHGFDEQVLAKHAFRIHKLRNSFNAWAQRLTGIFIKKNIAISRFIYDLYVNGRIARKSKMAVIYNGMDMPEIDESAYERKINAPYAVIVGRLVRYKGHEHLVNAWRIVKEYNPSFRLAILGKGIHEEKLKTMVKENDLDEQIIFTGHQDPHPYFHFSTCSLVSSLCEPFGLIILESWHHKKPVIAFDVPAVNELIDKNVNGFLVPPFDINELAKRIIYMFEHETEARAMGEAGKQKRDNMFNLQRMVDEYIDIYKQATNTK